MANISSEEIGDLANQYVSISITADAVVTHLANASEDSIRLFTRCLASQITMTLETKRQDEIWAVGLIRLLISAAFGHVYHAWSMNRSPSSSIVTMANYQISLGFTMFPFTSFDIHSMPVDDKTPVYTTTPLITSPTGYLKFLEYIIKHLVESTRNMQIERMRAAGLDVLFQTIVSFCAMNYLFRFAILFQMDSQQQDVVASATSLELECFRLICPQDRNAAFTPLIVISAKAKDIFESSQQRVEPTAHDVLNFIQTYFPISDIQLVPDHQQILMSAFRLTQLRNFLLSTNIHIKSAHPAMLARDLMFVDCFFPEQTYVTLVPSVQSSTIRFLESNLSGGNPTGLVSSMNVIETLSNSGVMWLKSFVRALLIRDIFLKHSNHRLSTIELWTTQPTVLKHILQDFSFVHSTLAGRQDRLELSLQCIKIFLNSIVSQANQGVHLPLSIEPIAQLFSKQHGQATGLSFLILLATSIESPDSGIVVTDNLVLWWSSFLVHCKIPSIFVCVWTKLALSPGDLLHRKLSLIQALESYGKSETSNDLQVSLVNQISESFQDPSSISASLLDQFGITSFDTVRLAGLDFGRIIDGHKVFVPRLYQISMLAPTRSQPEVDFEAGEVVDTESSSQSINYHPTQKRVLENDTRIQPRKKKRKSKSGQNETQASNPFIVPGISSQLDPDTDTRTAKIQEYLSLWNSLVCVFSREEILFLLNNVFSTKFPHESKRYLDVILAPFFMSHPWTAAAVTNQNGIGALFESKGYVRRSSPFSSLISIFASNENDTSTSDGDFKRLQILKLWTRNIFGQRAALLPDINNEIQANSNASTKAITHVSHFLLDCLTDCSDELVVDYFSIIMKPLLKTSSVLTDDNDMGLEDPLYFVKFLYYLLQTNHLSQSHPSNRVIMLACQVFYCGRTHNSRTGQEEESDLNDIPRLVLPMISELERIFRVFLQGNHPHLQTKKSALLRRIMFRNVTLESALPSWVKAVNKLLAMSDKSQSNEAFIRLYVDILVESAISGPNQGHVGRKCFEVFLSNTNSNQATFSDVSLELLFDAICKYQYHPQFGSFVDFWYNKWRTFKGTQIAISILSHFKPSLPAPFKKLLCHIASTACLSSIDRCTGLIHLIMQSSKGSEINYVIEKALSAHISSPTVKVIFGALEEVLVELRVVLTSLLPFPETAAEVVAVKKRLFQLGKAVQGWIEQVSFALTMMICQERMSLFATMFDVLAHTANHPAGNVWASLMSTMIIRVISSNQCDEKVMKDHIILCRSKFPIVVQCWLNRHVLNNTSKVTSIETFIHEVITLLANRLSPYAVREGECLDTIGRILIRHLDQVVSDYHKGGLSHPDLGPRLDTCLKSITFLSDQLYGCDVGVKKVWYQLVEGVSLWASLLVSRSDVYLPQKSQDTCVMDHIVEFICSLLQWVMKQLNRHRLAASKDLSEDKRHDRHMMTVDGNPLLLQLQQNFQMLHRHQPPSYQSSMIRVFQFYTKECASSPLPVNRNSSDILEGVIDILGATSDRALRNLCYETLQTCLTSDGREGMKRDIAQARVFIDKLLRRQGTSLSMEDKASLLAARDILVPTK